MRSQFQLVSRFIQPSMIRARNLAATSAKPMSTTIAIQRIGPRRAFGIAGQNGFCLSGLIGITALYGRSIGAIIAGSRPKRTVRILRVGQRTLSFHQVLPAYEDQTALASLSLARFRRTFEGLTSRSVLLARQLRHHPEQLGRLDRFCYMGVCSSRYGRRDMLWHSVGG